MKSSQMTHLNRFLNELNRNRSLNLPSHLIEIAHIFAPVVFPFALCSQRT